MVGPRFTRTSSLPRCIGRTEWTVWLVVNMGQIFPPPTSIMGTENFKTTWGNSGATPQLVARLDHENGACK